MSAPFRLSPTMASRKLQALRFIREFWDANGASPSLGEIGASLGVSRQHAHDIVHALANEGMIHKRRGPRGISPIDWREDVLRRLRAEGWRVDEDARELTSPSDLTQIRLLGLPVLDHLAGHGQGDSGTGDGDTP